MNRRLRRGQARKAKQSQSRGGSGAAALDNALATASRHHQAGRLRQAGALYRKILNAHPGNPDTLHLFGVLQHQLGRHEEAIGLLGDAVRAAPDQAPFHYNLAEACRLTGRFDDAVASYRRARELAPDMADISLGLGKTLLELGDLDAAIECIRRAIELAPDDADDRFECSIVGTASGFELQFRMEINTGDFVQAVGDSLFPTLPQYMMFTVVQDGTGYLLYINGSPESFTETGGAGAVDDTSWIAQIVASASAPDQVSLSAVPGTSSQRSGRAFWSHA